MKSRRILIAVCSLLVGGCTATVEPTKNVDTTPAPSATVDPTPAPVPTSAPDADAPDASPEVDAGPATPTPDAAPDAPTAVPDAGNPVPVPVVDAGPPPPPPGDFVLTGVNSGTDSLTLAYACGWSYKLKQICAQQIPGSTWGISTDCLTAGGESTGFYKTPWIIWNYQSNDPKILALSQSVAGGIPAGPETVGGTLNNSVFQASCIGGKMIMAGTPDAPIGVWCCAQ
jgi:hypothetical protein